MTSGFVWVRSGSSTRRKRWSAFEAGQELRAEARWNRLQEEFDLRRDVEQAAAPVSDFQSVVNPPRLPAERQRFTKEES